MEGGGGGGVKKALATIPPPIGSHFTPLEIFFKICKQKAKLKVNNESDSKFLNYKFIAAFIIVLVFEALLLFNLNYV